MTVSDVGEKLVTRPVTVLAFAVAAMNSATPAAAPMRVLIVFVMFVLPAGCVGTTANRISVTSGTDRRERASDAQVAEQNVPIRRSGERWRSVVQEQDADCGRGHDGDTLDDCCR
jgi:hypothetical protein